MVVPGARLKLKPGDPVIEKFSSVNLVRESVPGNTSGTKSGLVLSIRNPKSMVPPGAKELKKTGPTPTPLKVKPREAVLELVALTEAEPPKAPREAGLKVYDPVWTSYRH